MNETAQELRACVEKLKTRSDGVVKIAEFGEPAADWAIQQMADDIPAEIHKLLLAMNGFHLRWRFFTGSEENTGGEVQLPKHFSAEWRSEDNVQLNYGKARNRQRRSKQPTRHQNTERTWQAT